MKQRSYLCIIVVLLGVAIVLSRFSCITSFEGTRLHQQERIERLEELTTLLQGMRWRPTVLTGNAVAEFMVLYHQQYMADQSLISDDMQTVYEKIMDAVDTQGLAHEIVFNEHKENGQEGLI